MCNMHAKPMKVVRPQNGMAHAHPWGMHKARGHAHGALDGDFAAPNPRRIQGQ